MYIYYRFIYLWYNTVLLDGCTHLSKWYDIKKQKLPKISLSFQYLYRHMLRISKLFRLMVSLVG